MASSDGIVRKAKRREERESQRAHEVQEDADAVVAQAALADELAEPDDEIVLYEPPREALAAPRPSGVRFLASSDNLPCGMNYTAQQLLCAAEKPWSTDSGENFKQFRMAGCQQKAGQ